MKQLINKPSILSLTGGIIMSLAWIEHISSMLMLVAFVPFLMIILGEKTRGSGGSKVFTRLLPGFLLFNIITFSWLARVSVAGAIMAILAHSFLMSFTLWLVYMISLRASKITTGISFISLWLGYEYLCLNISIISPWLNTGNVFGKNPGLVQWYEFTGAGGGTLWVLAVNLLLYYFIINLDKNRAVIIRLSLISFLMILLPLLLSVYTEAGLSEEDTRSERIVIIQPNIDPYTQKFDSLKFYEQLENMLGLTSGHVDDLSDWLIFPETAIDDPFEESAANSNIYISRVRGYFSEYDSLNIILGATTTATFQDGNYSELYNSAVHLRADSAISFYHKSKLVPGFEKKVSFLPPFLEKIIIPDIGGSMSGYTTQEEREVFTNTYSKTKVAPLICYESAYGEFTSRYIHKGAGFIAIITNDGWWKNTQAYKQHLWFASLRAIENRRPVARCANTGISCFIDKKGRITESLPWWEEGVLVSEISPGEKITAYASHGDIIFRYSIFVSLVILVLTFVALPLRKLRKKQLI